MIHFSVRLVTTIILVTVLLVSPAYADRGSLSMWEILYRLSTMPDGSPNPRFQCTQGNALARTFIRDYMAYLGLEELGNDGYYFRLWGTELARAPVSGNLLCPQGIANVIGYVKGTKHPDEYILYDAHHDGPLRSKTSYDFNTGKCSLFDATTGMYSSENAAECNPNDDPVPDSGDTSNAFDDAAAVALGLKVAETLVKNPLERSVIFQFSDVEEGFTENFRGIFQENMTCDDDTCAGPNGICSAFAKVAPDYLNCTYAADSPDYYWMSSLLVGAGGFVRQPTIPIDQIKAVLSVDPVGRPFLRQSPMVAAIGTEHSAGLRDVIQQAIPKSDSALPVLFVNRKLLSENTNDADIFSTLYKYWCPQTAAGCKGLEGIPFIWFNEVGMSLYHGGEFFSGVRDFLDFVQSSFSNEIATTLAKAVRVKLDTLARVDVDLLEDTVEQVVSLVEYLSTADIAPYEETPDTFSAIDFKDAYALYNFSLYGLSKGSNATGIPQNVGSLLFDIFHEISGNLYDCWQVGDPAVSNDPFCQATITQTLPIPLVLDFFVTEKDGFDNPALPRGKKGKSFFQQQKSGKKSDGGIQNQIPKTSKKQKKDPRLQS